MIMDLGIFGDDDEDAEEDIARQGLKAHSDISDKGSKVNWRKAYIAESTKLKSGLTPTPMSCRFSAVDGSSLVVWRKGLSSQTRQFG